MKKDITKEEVQDDGKKRALGIVKSALEEAGIDPSEYDLSLKKTTRPKLAPNVMVFQTFARLASTELTSSANKILMYLFSQSVYENFVGIDVKTLAEELTMSERTVIRSINQLEENGIVLKTRHPTDKRRNDYFINPMGAWKGNSMTRKITLDQLQKEDPDQLHIFGETLPENKLRESLEIKSKGKRVNLFKKLDEGMHPSDVAELANSIEIEGHSIDKTTGEISLE